MLCSMTPPRLAYGPLWKEFAAEVEEPTQAVCERCGLRHDREGQTYCTTGHRWFSWLQRRQQAG